MSTEVLNFVVPVIIFWEKAVLFKKNKNKLWHDVFRTNLDANY